jgi:hypothetical protein
MDADTCVKERQLHAKPPRLQRDTTLDASATGVLQRMFGTYIRWAATH